MSSPKPKKGWVARIAGGVPEPGNRPALTVPAAVSEETVTHRVPAAYSGDEQVEGVPVTVHKADGAMVFTFHHGGDQ